MANELGEWLGADDFLKALGLKQPVNPMGEFYPLPVDQGMGFTETGKSAKGSTTHGPRDDGSDTQIGPTAGDVFGAAGDAVKNALEGKDPFDKLKIRVVQIEGEGGRGLGGFLERSVAEDGDTYHGFEIHINFAINANQAVRQFVETIQRARPPASRKSPCP